MADNAFTEPAIGSLRWQVKLARRTQVPEVNSTLIDDVYSCIATVHADIVPVGTAVYLNGVATENSITHRIIIRDDPTLTLFEFVYRDVIVPGNRLRHEKYQVRRVAPWAGRHRFLIIDAELLTSALQTGQGLPS